MNSKKIVFLFDVDNTLLDNDRIIADMKRHMRKAFGEERAKHYWEIFNAYREEMGYADYLGALQRYRLKFPLDPHLLTISLYLTNYPFANRLFPCSLDVLEHCAQFGETVILTDGDVVFQPRKVERSGLFDEVEKRVLIYLHKEKMLEDVERCYPAEHYVMVDDKLRILTAMKKAWGEKLTTIFPRQGHYAHDEKEIAKYPAADITIERIGELANYDLNQILAAARH